MREMISGALSSQFSGATVVSAKPKTKKKRPAPLSIRLSNEERILLQDWAGRTPLSTYVKSCLFEGKKPRRASRNAFVEDQEALARVLGRLGQSDIFNALTRLVLAVEEGRVAIQPDLEQELRLSLSLVSMMREDLVRAMGLRC